MFATENSIMGITPYIFTKKLFLLVAVLSFAVLTVQAQNNTHQSINSVLKQSAMAMNLGVSVSFLEIAYAAHGDMYFPQQCKAFLGCKTQNAD